MKNLRPLVESLSDLDRAEITLGHVYVAYDEDAMAELVPAEAMTTEGCWLNDNWFGREDVVLLRPIPHGYRSLLSSGLAVAHLSSLCMQALAIHEIKINKPDYILDRDRISVLDTPSSPSW